MTLPEYSKLKERVVRSVANRDNHSYVLDSLKELFRTGINSVRRYEQIRTIKQLLQVLELRDILSEDNVSPLKDIAEKIKNGALLNQIKEYEENHEPREYVNCYETEKVNKSISGFTSFETNMSKKKARIFQTVTDEIGTSWRALGRNLRIQEWVIDNIDKNCGSMVTKATEVLKKFDATADRVKWHIDLCEALDKIRRKELRHKVQDIMMMNI